MPFALPTGGGGIALATLYAPNGWIGAILGCSGPKIAFTPAGIFVALVFVALPFIVRPVQPLIAEIDRTVEEASATLGASAVADCSSGHSSGALPAMLTGLALAFARAVSEYGSVIFIAGNLPYVSEIAPLLIIMEFTNLITRRHGDRHDHARLVPYSACYQPNSGLEPAAAWLWLRSLRHRRRRVQRGTHDRAASY